MKRAVKKIITGFLLSSALFVISCKNGDLYTEFSSCVEDYGKGNCTVFIRADVGTGQTNPDSEVDFVIGKSYTVTFENNPSYYFINWIVVDRLTGEELFDVVDFSSQTSESTQVRIKNERENIWIKPYCLPYANIVSKAPLFSSTGVEKNQAVSVFFDQQMDMSSIYYTEEEINKLKSAGVKDTDFFYASDDDNGRCFGYKTGNEIVWKNIQITTVDSNENLLSYFQEPKLFNGKTSYLKILPNTTKQLSENTKIQVCISKDFLYKNGDISIPLAKNEFWTYRTNALLANFPPEFANMSAKIVGSRTGKNENAELLTTSDFEDLSGSLKKAALNNSHHKGDANSVVAFDLSGSVMSLEDQISEIKYSLNKVADSYYPGDQDEIITGVVMSFTEKKQAVDLTNKRLSVSMTGKGQGLYEIELTAVDTAANTNSWSFLFVWDNEIIQTQLSFASKIRPKNINNLSLGYEVYINYDISTSTPDQTVTLKYGTTAARTSAKVLSKTESPCFFDSWPSNMCYYTFDIEDVVGNKGTATYTTAAAWMKQNSKKFLLKYFTENDIIGGISLIGKSGIFCDDAVTAETTLIAFDPF